jgi:hypothetical protein
MNDLGGLPSHFNTSRVFYAIQVNLDGKFTYVNELFSEHYDLSESGLIAKPWTEAIYNEDQTICNNAIKQVLKNPSKSVHIRLRKPNAKKGVYFTEWELKLCSRPDKTKYIEGIGYNVSVQHKQLDALLGNSPDRMMILEAKGELKETLTNDRTKIIAHSAEAMLNQNEFYCQGECLRFSQVYNRLVSYGKMADIEYCLIEAGKTKWFLASAIAIEYDDAPCVLWTARDITRQKNIELRLLEQNRKFQEISYIQSHRVRRPVANIMGLLPLLEKEIYSEEGKLILELLKESTSEMDVEIHKIVKKSHTAA